MVPIKQNLANRQNYGGKRTQKVEWIVMHYTANDGDSDESNAKYFQQPLNPVASAHYFVDDDSITCSVPEDYVAYHCGAQTYRHPSCRNANSIGIEMCDARRDGKVQATDKTIANAAELAAQLCKKYGLTTDRIIRHYDVTGKLCPAYWVQGDGLANFRQQVARLLGEKNSKIIINGKEYGVDRVLQGGVNYIKLRDIAAALEAAGVCKLDVGNKGNIAVLTHKEK